MKIKDFDWLCENKTKALVKLDRIEDAREFERSIDDVIDWDVVFPKRWVLSPVRCTSDYVNVKVFIIDTI